MLVYSFICCARDRERQDHPPPPLRVGILPAAKSETYYWCILLLYIFFLLCKWWSQFCFFLHSVNTVQVHLYIAFSIFITKQVIKLIPSLAVIMLVNWTARVNLKKFLILSINQRVTVPVVLLTPWLILYLYLNNTDISCCPSLYKRQVTVSKVLVSFDYGDHITPSIRIFTYAFFVFA